MIAATKRRASREPITAPATTPALDGFTGGSVGGRTGREERDRKGSEKTKENSRKKGDVNGKKKNVGGKRERGTQKDGRSWMISVVLVWAVKCLRAEVSMQLNVSLQEWVRSILLFWHFTLPQCCFCPDSHSYVTKKPHLCLPLLELAFYIREPVQGLPQITGQSPHARHAHTHCLTEQVAAMQRRRLMDERLWGGN